MTNVFRLADSIHDFNQRKKQFVTFRPVQNGEAIPTIKGFQLVQYDLNAEKETFFLMIWKISL